MNKILPVLMLITMAISGTALAQGTGQGHGGLPLDTSAATECTGDQVLQGDGDCVNLPTDTNAATECSGDQVLDGDGDCVNLPTDTNAATICNAGEYLDGDGTCKSASSVSSEDINALLDFIDDLQTQINLLHPHRTVFVTLDTFTGESIGGALGGDTECQQSAEAAGLQGTYKAWLSDDSTSPDDRFYKVKVPYRLVDGTLIALDYDDLTDGSLANGIVLDQYGDPVVPLHAWTATDASGSHTGNEDANDWGNDVGGGDSYGGRGAVGATDSTWTDFLVEAKVHSNPLLCFQQ